MKDELVESMRDMQSEILRGMERFARGNFNALEERVLALETRPPRP